jgi:hypothetical protein
VGIFFLVLGLVNFSINYVKAIRGLATIEFDKGEKLWLV